MLKDAGSLECGSQLVQLAVSRHRWLLPPPELFILSSTNISSNFPRLICYNLHWHWRATRALLCIIHYFSVSQVKTRFSCQCAFPNDANCQYNILHVWESALYVWFPMPPCLTCHLASALYELNKERNKGDLQMLLVFSCGSAAATRNWSTYYVCRETW